MRNFLLTSCFIILFSLPLFSQVKIGIVDTSILMQSLTDQYQVDLLYNQLEERFRLKIEGMIDAFQIYYQNIQKRINGGCASLAQIKEMEKAVLARMDKIRDFESFIVDSLPAKREELSQILFIPIQEVTKAYAQEQQLTLVINKEQIEFFEPGLDITFQLMKKLQITDDLSDQLIAWEVSLIRESKKYE